MERRLQSSCTLLRHSPVEEEVFQLLHGENLGFESGQQSHGAFKLEAEDSKTV